MVARGSVGHEARRLGLGALLALALMMLAGVGQAAPQVADESERRLMLVTADIRDEIDQLQSKYDVGYIGEPTEAAVYVNADEEGVLRAEGYKIGEVIADRSTWEEIAATDARERWPGRPPRTAAPPQVRAHRPCQCPVKS
jgi:hypothetical protein